MNQLRIDGHGKVSYRAENSVRTLGRIVDRQFRTSRNPLKHILWKDLSIGFNLELMTGGEFDLVVVNITGVGRISAPKKRILIQGDVRSFTVGGGEEQVFLPLDAFDMHETVRRALAAVIPIGREVAVRRPTQLSMEFGS